MLQKKLSLSVKKLINKLNSFGSIAILLFASYSPLLATNSSKAYAANNYCEAGFFQYANNGTSPGLKKLVPTDGSYQLLGDGVDTNAVGYNVNDGFIYGVALNTSNLIRINTADGSTTVLGQPVNASNSSQTLASQIAAGEDITVGDVSDGKLYVLIGGDTGTRDMFAIDIATNTFTRIPLTYPNSTLRLSGDMVVLNGMAYSLDGNGQDNGTNTKRFTVINLTTGVVSVTYTTNFGTKNTFGAQWIAKDTDGTYRMFAYENNTGKIFEIRNFMTSTPSLQLIATSQGNISSNDGASCPDAPVPAFPIDAINDSSTTGLNDAVDINWTDNDDVATTDPFSLTDFDTSSANGGTITDNGDGTFHYTPPAGFTGVDTFTYTICLDNVIGGDPVCDTATVSITFSASINAEDDTNVTEINTPVSGDANPNDSGTDPYTVTSYDATSVNGGSVTMNPDGTYTYTPPAGFTGVDTFTYTICITGANPAICDTATVTITIVGPKLNLTKVADKTEHVAGDVVAYTISYSNTGDGEARNATLTETVPANTTYSGDAAEGWTCLNGGVAGSTCVKQLGTLAVSQTGSAMFTVTLDSVIEESSLDVVNTVSLDSDNTDPIEAEAIINVKSSSKLNVDKDDNGAYAEIGGDVVYVISYSNSGTKTEKDVILTETVPANTTYSGDAAEGWTCLNGGVAGSTCTYQVGDLAPEQSGSVEFTVTVNDNTAEGVDEINNTVSISGEDGQTQDNDDEQTPLDNGDVLGEEFVKNNPITTASTSNNFVSPAATLANTGDPADQAIIVALALLFSSAVLFIYKKERSLNS